MAFYSTRYLDEPQDLVTAEVDSFRRSILERPKNFAYFGDLDEDRWGRFMGQHRDSDVLERCNFHVIYTDLVEHYPEAVTIERSSHWLVGWHEVIRLDTHNEAAVRRALSWKLKLDDYPIADEDTYSEFELAAQEEDWESFGRDWTTDLVREHDDERIPLAWLDESRTWLEEDGETYAYYAFTHAWSDCGGDISEHYLIDHISEQYLYMIEDKRREFERAQPPLQGMED